MTTGIEGPGRIPSIACDHTDASVLFTRSYWPAWWRLNPQTGSFTQHRLPGRRYAGALADDGAGHIAIGMYPPASQGMSELLILDTKSKGTRTSELSDTATLVGTAGGFLAVAEHGAQFVSSGASHAKAARFTFAPTLKVEPSAGAGMLGDGRLVLFNGAGLVVFHPSAPDDVTHIPLDFDDCAPPDPTDSMKLSPGCVTAWALLAADDTGNVYVNNPRTNTIDQIG